MIISTASCCLGTECPSPLLGICPPCDNCTTDAPPTTKPPIEPSMVTAKLQNKFHLSQPVRQANSKSSLVSGNTLKTQPFKQKNFKGLIPSQFGDYGADKQGKAMVARSNFVFPWLKTVELYRKRRDNI